MTSASRITIEATAVSTVSYPMAYNRIAVLGPIRIGGAGRPVGGAQVAVTLQDAVGVLGSSAVLADLPGTGFTVLTAAPSPLDPAAMARVQEQQDGWLRVSVTIDGQVAAERSFPVTILAAQQWVARPPTLGLEMLAAFVMPNHPAIGALAREATDRLAAGALSGEPLAHQGEPEDADRVAEAVFEALVRANVVDAEPPSGWTDDGHLVRTPDEVLSGRVGTRLDAALVYAAALERSGLYPLVWVLPEHVLVGYWRADRSLSAAATTEFDGLVNLVDLGVIRVVDPAMALRPLGTAQGRSSAQADQGPESSERATLAEATASALATLHAAVAAITADGPGDADPAGADPASGEPVGADPAGADPAGARSTRAVSAQTTTGVVDIRAARRDQILPLPARITAPDGTVTVVAYQPPVVSPVVAGASTTLAAPTRIVAGQATTKARPLPPQRIAAWKNALLDLSMRNRLLNYATRSGVHLEVPPGTLAALEDTVTDGGAITLLPADQVGGVQVQRGVRFGRELTEGQRADLLTSRRSVYCDVPSDAYDTRMRRLLYRVRTVAEETGANTLYLALGSLVWTVSDSSVRPTVSDSSVRPTVSDSSVRPTVPDSSVRPTVPDSSVRPTVPDSQAGSTGRDSRAGTTGPDRPLRSPLVLVPIRLTTRARHGAYRIELDEAGTSTPNYCLLEKLRQVYGLTVPGLAEPATDASGIDLDAAFRALRTALADADLPFRVEETADIAALAFAKFRLWKDLDDAWEELTRSPLVAHLATTPTERFADPAAGSAAADLDDLATRCPIPADASQLDAIAAATAGETFVLEGPPGTGKSQTITNVLAHAMASGQRVLFVAEKRAALDVVTRRLNAIGLGPYCLDLHDKGARPATVRAAVRAALDAHQAGDPQGLAAETARMRSAAGTLGRYATRLHDSNGAGLSFYSAHTQSLAVGDGAALPVPDIAVTSGSGLDEVRRALVSLPDAADPAGPRPGHPWGFVDPPDPAGADPDEIADAVAELTGELTGWWAATPIAQAVEAARRPSELSALAMFAGTWAQDLGLIDDAASSRWRAAADAARTRTDEFTGARHPGFDVVRPEALGLPLEEIDRDAREAAASSWFGRKKRQLAVVARFDGLLRDGATIPRKEVAALTRELLRTWNDLAQLQIQVSAVPGLTTPPGWNPVLPADREWLDDRISWLGWAGATASLRDRSGRLISNPEPFRVALRQVLESRAVIGDAERELLDRLASAAARLAGLAGGDDPFAAWTEDGSTGLTTIWERTAADRAADPAALRRRLALVVHLQPLRTAGLGDAREMLLTGAVPAADAARAFDSGVAATSLRERAAATGLGGFDPVAHGGAVATFVSSADRVRDQLLTAIPAGLIGDRTFDAASGYGRIGELTRELARQRGGLAVRGLMTRYGDLITRIMPCTLVSPDSLARFFPPQRGLFDLVVFDEASQIRVADAIGALGRADAAVVVGDSKQMPPTSFAESTWIGAADTPGGSSDNGGRGSSDGSMDLDPDEITETAVEDEESILAECVQAGLARRWLSWHYRSQDETLIAFSNRRYYEDRLSSFPSPISGRADPSTHGHGVNLVRVHGAFLRSGAGQLLRTNPIEAVAVVTEIRDRFAAAPGEVPSIGVVTFNAQQRTHIEALLRDLHDERITDALDRTDGEGLFVKNLENVQGDERDVILFSTAFSANARGVLPLNFGPLNQVGGERRLNVAITRARRQVIVFSSFDPEDLRAEETSAQGIKDLRAYLDLAKAGSGESVGTSPRAPAADRHRDEIAVALRDRGLPVTTNVGLSDFTLDLAVGPPDTAPAGGDRGPDGAKVAVLLDGPSWAARRTVGDRDGLPVDVLSRLMGWPAVQRVWLPEWLHDRDGVLGRLQSAAVAVAVAQGAPGPDRGVDRDLDTDVSIADPHHPAPDAHAGNPGPGTSRFTTPTTASSSGNSPSTGSTSAGPEQRAAAASATVANGVDGPPETWAAPALSALRGPDITDFRSPATPAGDARDGGSAPEALPGESAFVPWRSGYLGGRDVLDALPRPSSIERVARALTAGIQAEGPIHTDRLARLIAGGFDLGRVTAERRAAILACLPPEPERDSTDPGFAWPAGMDAEIWTGFRRTGPTDDRPLEHVSPREIGNAMAALCVAGAGLNRDQLFQQTLLIFGFRRRTPGQLALLEAALNRAAVAGRLQVVGSLVVARGT